MTEYQYDNRIQLRCLSRKLLKHIRDMPKGERSRWIEDACIRRMREDDDVIDNSGIDWSENH
jgi:hypothetical protein